MAYEIVKYTPEFRDQVLLLQRRLWGPDLSANSAYFKWKYEVNPYGGSPLIYLSLSGGRVVGMRGFWAAAWCLGQPRHRIPAVCAGDTVVMREHENRGLIRRIMRFAENDLIREGYQCLINLSAGPAIYLFSLRNGWIPVQPYRTVRIETGGWAAIHSLHTRLRRLRGFSRLIAGDLFYDVPQKLRSAFTSNAHGCLSASDTPRPSEMADVVEKATQDERLGHVMDCDYYAWRFENPLSSYRFLYWDDAGLQGFLILQRRYRRHYGLANIVDWQASSSFVKERLIQEALKSATPAAISIWTATRSDVERRLLEQAGFTASDETRGIKHYNPSLLIRLLDDGTQSDFMREMRNRLSDPNGWDLRMMFSDRY
jgi:GNAT superfamily N-acetyltransferase